MNTHSNIEAADGVRLHAASEGEAGPLLLFLHGFPEYWQSWHRQLPAFAATHRAVALDLRGYNLSDKPPRVTDYELLKLVDDVRRVIRALSPDTPVSLVGHDWGGIIAWTLARESPELLQRLVILNAPHPAIFYRELKDNPKQQLSSTYAAYFQLRGLAEVTLEAFDHAALGKMVWGTSSKQGQFSPELRAAYHEAWRQPGALTGGLNYYRNVGSLKQTIQALQPWRIEVPTLVLWGEQDPALRRDNLVGLDRYVPKLTVYRHPSATHWIHHEEPDWVNERIRAFVGG